MMRNAEGSSGRVVTRFLSGRNRPGGTFELDGQTFSLLATGLDKSSAYFSATLQSGMTEGTYSYYIAYPLPDSAEGGKAVFTVPAVQDGIASGGVDIIVATCRRPGIDADRDRFACLAGQCDEIQNEASPSFSEVLYS